MKAKAYVILKAVICMAVFIGSVFIVTRFVNAEEVDYPTLTSITIVDKDAKVEETVTVDLTLGASRNNVSTIEMVFKSEDGKETRLRKDFETYLGGGNHTVEFEFPEFSTTVTGEYTLTVIWVTDSQGQTITYVKSLTDDNKFDGQTGNMTIVNSFPYNPDEYTIQVTNDSVSDGDGPILKSIECVSENISVPGTVNMKIEFEDDSKLKMVEIYLENSNQRRISLFSDMSGEMLNSGTHIISFLMDAGIEDTYRMTGIALTDEYNNISWWNINEEGYYYDALGSDPSITYGQYDGKADFTVSHSEANDDIGPTIHSFSFEKNTFTAPTVAVLNVDMEDQGSGIYSVEFVYENSMGRELRLYADKNDMEFVNGMNKLEVSITPYVTNGEYDLKCIFVTDNANNTIIYSYSLNTNENVLEGHVNGSSNFETTNTIPYSDAFQIHVEQGIAPDVTANVADSNLIDKIENMVDRGTAVITYTEWTSVVRKELFEVIQGTEKTVVFENGGIQWVFNGKDIRTDNIKDVDLNLRMEVVSGDEYGYDEKVVLLTFPDNGVLPGEAEIRIKSAYAFKQFGIKGNFSLIYIGNEGLKEESNEVTCMADHYTCFTVTHNSKFILAPIMGNKQESNSTVTSTDDVSKTEMTTVTSTDDVFKTEMNGSNTSSPKTGDSVNVMALTILALLGFATCMILIRKHGKQE